MTQLTRRSLLGGLAVVGAGTLATQTAHADATATTAATASGTSGQPGTPTAAQASPAPLQAPSFTVVTRQPGTAPGLIFLTTQGFAAPTSPRGPQIVDEQGRTVWFRSIALGTFSADFRVQTYQGRQVLTWWEGTAGAGGIGNGVGYIADTNYQIIATVRAPGGGSNLDLHEFRLTPEGTALVIVYRQVTADLSSVGGPTNGQTYDCVVYEIDIASGQPVLEWHGIQQVPVNETGQNYQGAFGGFDYLHVNGVGLDTDGNLLISGRHTSTVYKVDRRTGQILWRLGGKASDFQMGTGATFAWHHDGQGEGGGVYRVFDNATHGTLQGTETRGTRQSDQSRVLWLEVDEAQGTATVLNQFTHPQRMLTVAEGGAQRLPNGNTMVSWGQSSRVSEFSPSGQLLLDATLPQGMSTYRAYRHEWQGQPAGAPEVAVDSSTGELHAVWNGATGVAAWRVLGGRSDAGLRPVARLAWGGWDTVLTLPDSLRRDLGHVRVQALDSRGRVLGTSPITSLGDAANADR
ncbi:arylsulfotransferase family protein [Streptomyces sp. 4N509B]|uniref:arylsulfotransferase family protein n=1 Tax=Streptomyces sp. 4N509B TaxID=3457413 RepID=UPI003FCF486E